MSEQRVVYLGRRVMASGKLAHAFTLEAAQDAVGIFGFRRGKWVVGGVYVTEGEADENGRMRSLTAPGEWGGVRVPDETQIATWELLDRQAQQTHAAQAAEARARRNPTYAHALEEWAPVMDSARTFAEAEAIAETIRRSLIEGWHRRARANRKGATS